jgi:hypothetical protein
MIIRLTIIGYPQRLSYVQVLGEKKIENAINKEKQREEKTSIVEKTISLSN